MREFNIHRTHGINVFDDIIQWCHDVFGPAASYYGKLAKDRPRWHVYYIYESSASNKTTMCIIFKNDEDATFFSLRWL